MWAPGGRWRLIRLLTQRETVLQAEAPTSGPVAGHNRWDTAEFTSDADKDKFQRLMVSCEAVTMLQVAHSSSGAGFSMALPALWVHSRGFCCALQGVKRADVAASAAAQEPLFDRQLPQSVPSVCCLPCSLYTTAYIRQQCAFMFPSCTVSASKVLSSCLPVLLTEEQQERLQGELERSFLEGVRRGNRHTVGLGL